MRGRGAARVALWCGLFLSAGVLCDWIGRYLDGGEPPPETSPALWLLGVNALFFAAAALFPRMGEPWNHPNVGLGWVTVKLFVNTFTIFLFIGLQAGRTHVFVLQFFGAYFWLLPGSLLLLSRQS